MELAGVAAASLIAALIYPLLMVLAVAGRWLPWRLWAARLRAIGRMS